MLAFHYRVLYGYASFVRHVTHDCTRWLKKQNTAYILKEAAILFESGAYKQVDKVLTVVAPLELKIQRTMKRDGVSKEEVERRMQLQMTDEEKIKRADFVIINNEQELLIPQVFSLNQQLVNK